MKRKLEKRSFFVRCFALLLAFLLVAGPLCGAFTPVQAAGSEVGSDSAPSLDELVGFTKKELIAHLESHEHDHFYLGTPYAHGTMQEMGDAYFRAENVMLPGKSMNCTGFVCYVLRQIGGALEVIKPKHYLTGAYVTNASNWFRYIVREKNAKSYRFNNVRELLDSGLATKGDILYFEPMVWSKNTDAHIGFFWGDTPKENKFWHSDHQGNRISTIQSKYPNCALYLFKIRDIPKTPPKPPESKKGALRVRKVSDRPELSRQSSQYRLEGAQFAVRDASHALVGTLTTGADGQSNTLNNLKEGKYTLQETQAPAGFALDPKEYPVNVVGNRTATFRAKDSVKYDPISLLLKKKSSRETGTENLSGAEFTCSYFDTLTRDVSKRQPVRSWKFRTDAKGEIHLASPYRIGGDDFFRDPKGRPVGLIGTYVFQETKAPKGYVLDSRSYYGFVTDSGTEQILHSYRTPVVPNAPVVGSIHGQKTDAETKAPIPGTRLGLFTPQGKVARDANGKEISPVLTDARGNYRFQNLPFGNYLVKELEPAKGYVKETLVKKASIVNNEDRVMVNFTNQPQKMRFTLDKLDIFSGDRPQGQGSLRGAEFEIRLVQCYRKGATLKKGQRMGILRTDAFGRAQSPDLPLGIYDIVETKAPLGYDRNPVAIRIEGKADGKGGIYTTSVHQKTENGKTLLNAFSEKVRELNELNRINANGSKNYRTFEVESPAPFAIKEQDPAHVCSYDLAKYGRIALSKHADGERGDQAASQSGERLKEGGIAFSVKNSKGQVVDSFVTDAAGRGSSRWLPYGTYRVHQQTPKKGFIRVPDFSVTVKDSFAEYQYNLENYARLAWLKIVKIDRETKKEIPQAGITFELYEETGKQVHQWVSYPVPREIHQFVTDSSGTVQLPQRLREGRYYLKEIRGPQGYYLNPTGDKIPVDIRADGSVAPVVVKDVTNLPQKGQVLLQKTGNLLTGIEWDKADPAILRPIFTKQLLAGSKWEILAAEDIISLDGKTVFYRKGETVDRLVTNAKTAVRSKLLPLGTYILRETKAPKAFVKETKDTVFSLTPQASTIRVQALTRKKHNERKEVRFHFVKSFEQSRAFTKGMKATFGLFLKEAYTENGITIPKDTLLAKTTVTAQPETGKDTISVTGKFAGISIDGTFYMKELAGSEGYRIDERKREVVADFSRSNDPEQTVRLLTPIPNDLVSIDLKVYKFEMGSDPKLPVEGAKYRLVAVDAVKGETVIGQYMTDKNGIIKVNNLDTGTYYLEELEAATGYRKDEGRTDLVIDGKKDGEKKITIWEEKIPSIRTFLFDALDHEKDLPLEEDIKILDRVSYWDLIPGKEYRLQGTLLRKRDGEVIARGEQSFVPTSRNSDVDVEFLINSKELVGEDLVAGEILLRDGKILTRHMDREDEKQTIHVPAIRTHATGERGEQRLDPSQTVVIQDKVSFTNLLVGKEYTILGRLMDRESGKALLVKGKPVTARKTFTPKSADGAVTMEFLLDASTLRGKQSVVFEKLYRGKKLVAFHEKLTDSDQTIQVTNPGLQTRAFVTGDKKLVPAKGREKIYDLVHYRDLIVGKTYTLRTRLVLVDDPRKGVLERKTSFVPETTEGDQKVDLGELDLREFAGKKLVVIEELRDEKGNLLARHDDVSDAKQTITIQPLPPAPPKEQTPPKKEAPPTGEGALLAWTGLLSAALLTGGLIRKRLGIGQY